MRNETITPSNEGLFYDLAVASDVAASSTLELDEEALNSWERLLSRSLRRFYQLYGVKSGSSRAMKLKESLRSLVFDVGILGLLGQPKLDIDASGTLFSVQGDHVTIRFASGSFGGMFVSRMKVSMVPLPFLPIGWLSVMRSAQIIEETQGLPIKTNLLLELAPFRRLSDWGQSLLNRVVDRRRRLEHLPWSSRYTCCSYSIDKSLIQAKLKTFKRFLFRKCGLLKRDDFLPRFLVDKLFRLPRTKDDPLIARLFLYQRFLIQTKKKFNYHKLLEYEKTYRPFVSNPSYSHRHVIDSLASLIHYLSFLDMNLIIRTDDKRWFSFEQWQRQLLFTVKLTRRFLRQIKKGVSR